MKPRFIDWIWHIKGSLTLAPEQSSEEAFDRLDPLFRQAGTSHDRMGDQLTFRKKDQAAQDKMSIFDGGVLQIRQGTVGPVLSYQLKSRALLFCFLMPLFFLGLAQITLALGQLEKSHPPAADKSKTSLAAAKKPKKSVELPQNPIDKALGAPAPEKPKDETSGKPKDEDNKFSPKSAYIFAAIFSILYVAGRILEDRKVKALFKKNLMGLSGL